MSIDFCDRQPDRRGTRTLTVEPYRDRSGVRTADISSNTRPYSVLRDGRATPLIIRGNFRSHVRGECMPGPCLRLRPRASSYHESCGASKLAVDARTGSGFPWLKESTTEAEKGIERLRGSNLMPRVCEDSQTAMSYSEGESTVRCSHHVADVRQDRVERHSCWRKLGSRPTPASAPIDSFHWWRTRPSWCCTRSVTGAWRGNCELWGNDHDDDKVLWRMAWTLHNPARQPDSRIADPDSRTGLERPGVRTEATGRNTWRWETHPSDGRATPLDM